MRFAKNADMASLVGLPALAPPAGALAVLAAVEADGVVVPSPAPDVPVSLPALRIGVPVPGPAWVEVEVAKLFVAAAALRSLSRSRNLLVASSASKSIPFTLI